MNLGTVGWTPDEFGYPEEIDRLNAENARLRKELSDRLQFRPNPPTVSGWYWYCERRKDGTVTKARLMNVCVPIALNAFLGGNIPFWAGPIPKPVPLESKFEKEATR